MAVASSCWWEFSRKLIQPHTSRRLTRRPAYSQSRHRATTADDPFDDDFVWSQLSASDVLDLGRVIASVAQQLTSESVRNLRSLALNLPRHPLNLLLPTTWSPKLCTKLCRTLPRWTKCLLLVWPLSCRLCDFLNIAVANGDWKVMLFAFLRTSNLSYQFCPMSPLMFFISWRP